MSNNYLENLAINLQVEYKELLAVALEKLTDSWFQIIDSIEIFWRKNKSLVLCLLHNYFTPWETYVFTAATYIDYKDGEHLSFLAVGNKRILDDPSCLYMRSHDGITNDYKKLLEDQIKRTLEDNYTILNNCKNEIFILPIRYFSEVEEELIYDGAEQAFCSLFKDINSMRDYFQMVKSFDDLESHLKPTANSKIFFGIVEDNLSLSLKERLEIFEKNHQMPIGTQNAGQVFYFGIYSIIAQTMDVLLFCSLYKLIPFIRNRATFLYLINLLAIVKEQEDFKKITYLSSVAYVTRKLFDKSKLNNISATQFIITLQSTNFYNQLINELSLDGCDEKNFSVNAISECIDKHLNDLYDKLNTK